MGSRYYLFELKSVDVGSSDPEGMGWIEGEHLVSENGSILSDSHNPGVNGRRSRKEISHLQSTVLSVRFFF